MFVKKADGTTTKNKTDMSGVKITRIIIRSKLRDRRERAVGVLASGEDHVGHGKYEKGF